MKITTLKLCVACRETATGIDGMITHWIMSGDKHIRYLFQPRGINPEDGQPVKRLVVNPERLAPIDSSELLTEEVDVPFEIIGSIITDDPSGFTGTATGFVRHTNGCFHVFIQPSGRLEKTMTPIAEAEFDLRRCSGEMIPKLTEVERKKSEQDKPSPTDRTFTEEIPLSGTVFNQ